jgi:hypothetical protein
MLLVHLNSNVTRFLGISGWLVSFMCSVFVLVWRRSGIRHPVPAGARELAGASWRWIAGRPSPACPRQWDAAATPLSSVSPPLHLMARLKVGELLLPLILRSCCLPWLDWNLAHHRLF